MTDEQIKHMVNRFLQWKLPADFAPDNGVTFNHANAHDPVGTNLLDANQAEQMVRFMADGLPNPTPTPNSPELLAKEWKFKCWYKERFSFTNGTDTLEFTPYFRSDIDPVMTLKQVIAEGCEDIEINNVPLGLSGEQEDKQ